MPLRYRCSMRVDLLTREYPPEVYGGAGVHVAELVRALRRDLEVFVRCFGGPRDEQGTFAYPTPRRVLGPQRRPRHHGRRPPDGR